MASLLSQSYSAIKNTYEKKLATEITIGSCIDISSESLNIIQSKTLTKKLHIDISDRMGSHITFTLVKKTGVVHLIFHKKHSFHCSVIINDISNNQQYDIIKYKTKSLNQLLVEIILNEFPNMCRSYLENGMRKKTKIVKNLVCDLIQYHNTMSIHCEINDNSIVKVT